MNKHYRQVKSEIQALGLETPDRKKIGSVSDLLDFIHVGANTLIHKSKKDLWSLQTDKKGNSYIERLFDDNERPLENT